MPASDRPAFGQVWRYDTVLYMVIARDLRRTGTEAFLVLYLGASGVPVEGAANLWKSRIRENANLFESMAGFPGGDDWFEDPAWERVE